MIKILQGDVRDMLKTLPAESVQCVVTSPPYWGLRCYGVEGQIGLEPTLAEHIAVMVDMFREVRRVLRKDGTIWLNYGDCYATAPNGRSAADTKATGNDDRTFRDKPFSTVGGTLKPKDLCMVPNRLAIALQDDGWWVRSEIIWAKPNPMPESVTDRPATAHEKVWLLTKSARYFYDAEAVRSSHESRRAKSFRDGGIYTNNRSLNNSGDNSKNTHGDGEIESGANLRNVWTIPTKGYSEAHFATFPPALVEPCIKAGTSEKGCCAECGAPWVRETSAASGGQTGASWHDHSTDDEAGNNKAIGGSAWRTYQPGKTLSWSPSCACDADTTPCTVLDPFGGSGTTGMVADRLGRNAILIELNPDYADMARDRLTKDAGMFAEVT